MNILSSIRLDSAAQRLDRGSIIQLSRSEEIVQKLENKFDRKIRKTLEGLLEKTIEAFESGSNPGLKEIEEVIVENFFESALEGFREAKRGVPPVRMASAPPKFKMPRSFRDLMEMYDLWKKGRIPSPKRQKKISERIKKEYLRRCRDAWDRYGEGFRTGGAEGRVEAIESIRKAAKTTTSRAQTIVRTETTSSYNDARKKFFDKSPEVSHYLFLAIRDKRTTPWCSKGYHEGKRGRHGLVYAKEDPLLEQEKPACHWNCRSTIVPLLEANPKHKKMIEDRGIARRNHQCYPLPPGWRSSG